MSHNAMPPDGFDRGARPGAGLAGHAQDAAPAIAGGSTTRSRTPLLRLSAVLGLLAAAAACDSDAGRPLAPEAVSAAQASGGGSGPASARVIPPQARPHGRSYGEWAAAWWQYALSFPVGANPLYGEAGSCAAGQSGHVWFLSGLLTGSPTVVRTDCVVPTGVMLFIPVVTAACAVAQLPPPPPEEVTACAAGLTQGATDLVVEIDGRPVKDLGQFRAPSPVFGFTLPEGNVFGVPAGSCVPNPGTGACEPWLAAADGFFVMLPPLPPGEHTIHLRGTLPAFGVTLDVTYAPLTVVPRGRLNSSTAASSASDLGNRGASAGRGTVRSPQFMQFIQKRGKLYVGIG